MCERCDQEPITHQCKGGCNKHVCGFCGYKCAGNCGYAVCHDDRMQQRISPEKIHYYCKGCIGRYSMG